MPIEHDVIERGVSHGALDFGALLEVYSMGWCMELSKCSIVIPLTGQYLG